MHYISGVAGSCTAIWMVQCMLLRSCRVAHCGTKGAVKGTAKTMHRPFNNCGSFKQSLASVIFQRQVRSQPVGQGQRVSLQLPHLKTHVNFLGKNSSVCLLHNPNYLRVASGHQDQSVASQRDFCEKSKAQLYPHLNSLVVAASKARLGVHCFSAALCVLYMSTLAD